jgi:hypothetical protein
MPAHLLSNEALALRQGVTWNEYQRDHVPGNKRRQVFTGGDKVTDQTASSHEAVVKLFDTAFFRLGLICDRLSQSKNVCISEVL